MSDEMVEKARAFANDFHRSHGQTPHWTWEQVDEVLVAFARSVVRDAVRECIALVEHFGNDELTPEEWPRYGLYKAEGRFDSGHVKITCKNVASALRKKFEVEG